LSEPAQRIGNIGQQIGQAIAVKVGGEDDVVLFLDQVPQP
jgi:hypothetical protein